MKKRPFIAVTAGHVDHGKSSLVEALSGTDPDRLPEEKRRGVTIELGFAQLNLLIDHSDVMLQIGLVDVPGHENFVKTMVSGMGMVDMAILVVAANEGWMAQTEEHLQILEYVDVRSRILALTKCDLLTDLKRPIAQLRAAVSGTSFASAPIVPLSVLKMTGLQELRRYMADQLLSLSPARDNCLTRLSVDRIFSVAGAGTIVTGTVSGGTFKENQEVQIWPSQTSARIRSIENFNHTVKHAGPSTRVGINLSINRTKYRGIQRGDIITHPRETVNTKQFDALLIRSNRQRDVLIRHGAQVRLHHGTANLPVTVYLESRYAKAGLPNGNRAFVRIKLDLERPFLVGDHFVLRDWSQRHTLGGGVVLVPSPRRALNHNLQISLLSMISRAPQDEELVIQAYTECNNILHLKDLSLIMPSSFHDLERQTLDLTDSGTLLYFQNVAVEPKWFARQVTMAEQYITKKLKNEPERTGVAIASLTDLISPHEVLNAVVAELQSRGYRRMGSLIQPKHYTPSLPSSLERVAVTMRAVLNENPLVPPSRSQLVAQPSGTTVLQFLVNSGEAVMLDNKTTLSISAYQSARKKIIQFLLLERKATTSALRIELGTNRRIIVPLLENLDREGVTRRIGNERTLSDQSTFTKFNP